MNSVRIYRVVIAGLGLVSSLAAAASPPTRTYPKIAEAKGGDSFWDYASYLPEEHRLYIGREDGVTVMDATTGRVTLSLLQGQQGHAVVPLSNGRALVTFGAQNKAVIFERATGKVLAEIPTGRKPDGAGLDPATRQLLIMDGLDGDAVFADSKTGAVLGHLALGGEPGSPMFDGHGKAFTNISDKSEIAVIDMVSRKVVARYALPSCEDASGLGLDRVSGVLLSTCKGLKAVATDAATGKPLGTVPIGKYPDAVITDPVRHVFYVPTIDPGELTVVGVGRNRAPVVLTRVSVAPGVHTGALDATGGRLFLPAGELKLVHGQRPTVVPGTFRILTIDVTR